MVIIVASMLILLVPGILFIGKAYDRYKTTVRKAERYLAKYSFYMVQQISLVKERDSQVQKKILILQREISVLEKRKQMLNGR